jgi:hypothetical protein
MTKLVISESRTLNGSKFQQIEMVDFRQKIRLREFLLGREQYSFSSRINKLSLDLDLRLDLIDELSGLRFEL